MLLGWRSRMNRIGSDGEHTALPTRVGSLRRLHTRPVMVVDDDVAFRRDVCAALAEAGVPVVAAGDGRDALLYLRGAALKPGLLVVDLLMPGMDGFSLLSALAAEPSLSTIPVIVLSSVSTGIPARASGSLHEADPPG